MRLLVDEMYPPRLADQLRRRGVDAVAISERTDWRSLADAEVFALAQEERRAIVTENISDFIGLATAAEQRRTRHHGLVLVDPIKFPRGRNSTLGSMVRLLAELATAVPEDAPHSLRHWL